MEIKDKPTAAMQLAKKRRRLHSEKDNESLILAGQCLESHAQLRTGQCLPIEETIKRTMKESKYNGQSIKLKSGRGLIPKPAYEPFVLEGLCPFSTLP